LGTISLDLKEDKTFEMTVVFPLKGTWVLAGSKLTLTPTLKEGETMSFGGKKTMDFEVDASGTSMTSSMDDDGMKGSLVMTKSDAGK
ncbi:MAG: hypothetical protein H7Y17_13050, partial [Chlorobia bacterium]|nr:hypothetical protein [Fimbriimonadaceae bacterium]